MTNPDAAFGPDGLRAAIKAKVRASRPRDRRIATLQKYAGYIGAFVAVVGLAVILSWFLGIDRITRLGSDFATMKFTTALSLAGVGLALVLAARGLGGRGVRVVAGLAVIGGTFALFTIFEYLVGMESALDNPFSLDTESVEFPGRMSLATAIGLVLLWVALAALVVARVKVAQALAAACLGLGLMTLLGYAYGVDELYEFGPFSSTAVHTALGLAVSATAVLLLRAGDGFMALVTGNTAGGIIVRWMAPLAVLSPMVVGALVRLGLGNQYSGPVALALFATIMATLGGVMILYGGGRLRNVDIQRAGAEETLRLAQEAIAARDVMAAELSAAERRTREILDSAAEAYIATTLDGVALEWNDAATAMFGWTRKEIIGMQVRDVIVSATESQRVRSLMRIDEPEEVQSDEPVLGRQVPLVGRRKSGGHLDIEVTTWRLGEGDDTVLHSMMTDVTARRRAERELRLALDDIGDFSAAMAHDLKGPLTVVKGYSQLLEKRIDDQELAQLTGRITAAADRGVHLIDDILAFAQIGARRRNEDLVDLTALVREVAADEQTRVQRRTTVDVQHLPPVLGDDSLLRQLFGNLIGNALKYVPEGQDPAVSVVAEVNPEDGTFDVSVCDNGAPIAAADRDLIFTMFGRGTNTEGRQGTGVGLAICRRVAELHDGSIRIEATDSGNCFVTTLSSVAGD